MIHEGFFIHRITQNNPREFAFYDKWWEENKGNRPLIYELIPDATERDCRVAATIIQWLGSNVGQSFLQEVQKRIDEQSRD